MASSATQGQSRASPPLSFSLRDSPWLYVDALVVAALAVVGAVFLFLYPDAREWAYQALGYGWAPVALWAASVVFTLRYMPRRLARYWRRWAVAAACVALALGGGSYLSPTDGLLEEVSYAGRWGFAIGGPTLVPLGSDQNDCHSRRRAAGFVPASGRTNVLPRCCVALAPVGTGGTIPLYRDRTGRVGFRRHEPNGPAKLEREDAPTAPSPAGLVKKRPSSQTL